MTVTLQEVGEMGTPVGAIKGHGNIVYEKQSLKQKFEVFSNLDTEQQLELACPQMTCMFWQIYRIPIADICKK